MKQHTPYAAATKLPPQQWEADAAARRELAALRLRVADLERMLDDAVDDLVAALQAGVAAGATLVVGKRKRGKR